MHLKRLIVAFILLPLFYLFVMFLSSDYFLFLLIVISILALSEFYSMYKVTGLLKYTSFFWGIVILITSYIYNTFLFEIIIISFINIIFLRLLIKREPLSSLKDISPAIIGLLYIPGLLSFQTQIRMLGPEWIILLYATVWISDSMAYYLGKGVGKRSLYSSVSPNKTIAGAFGAIIGALLSTLFFGTSVFSLFTLSTAVLIGIIIGIFSIIGDLVESMFKRDAGVKDSASILPGHGGILDKIDAVLFVSPVVYLFLIFMGKIQVL